MMRNAGIGKEPAPYLISWGDGLLCFQANDCVIVMPHPFNVTLFQILLYRSSGSIDPAAKNSRQTATRKTTKQKHLFVVFHPFIFQLYCAHKLLNKWTMPSSWPDCKLWKCLWPCMLPSPGREWTTLYRKFYRSSRLLWGLGAPTRAASTFGLHTEMYLMNVYSVFKVLEKNWVSARPSLEFPLSLSPQRISGKKSKIVVLGTRILNIDRHKDRLFLQK